MKKTILVVDDHPLIASAFRACFATEFEVLEARNIAEAKEQAMTHKIACSLLDLDLGRNPQGECESGITLVKYFAKNHPDMGVILQTANPDSYVYDPRLVDDIFFKGNDPGVIRRYIYHSLWLRAALSEAHSRIAAIMRKPVSVTPQLEDGDEGRVQRIDITLKDGATTAFAVYVDPDLNPNRVNICPTSTLGCKIGCSTCRSGRRPFKRVLSCKEILSQVLLGLRTYLAKPVLEGHGVLVINICSEGEPLTNLGNCCRAIEILLRARGIKCEFIITTVGLASGLRKFRARYIHLPVTFYWSVVYTNDDNRHLWMPGLIKETLAEQRDELQRIALANGRQITASQFIREGINDRDEDVTHLCELIGGRMFPDGRPIFTVKLQPYVRNGVQITADEVIARYGRKLGSAGLEYRIRPIIGIERRGGCGDTEPNTGW